MYWWIRYLSITTTQKVAKNLLERSLIVYLHVLFHKMRLGHRVIISERAPFKVP